MLHQDVLIGKHPFMVRYGVIVAFPSHWHEEIEIIYCTHGSFYVCLNNEKYIMQKGDAIFIGSTEIHEIICDNVDSEFLVIEFGARVIGDEFIALTRKSFKYPVLKIDNPDILDKAAALNIQELFSSIITEYNNKALHYEFMLRGYIFMLYVLLCRYIPTYEINIPAHEKSIYALNNLRKVFDFVEENYASEITLNKAAELTNYNIKSFCRVFKETTNTTFHNYLNTYRIECATELLKQKDLSITKIAFMVGIPVTKSFTRIFRQKTGLNPTEYRRLIK